MPKAERRLLQPVDEVSGLFEAGEVVQLGQEADRQIGIHEIGLDTHPSRTGQAVDEMFYFAYFRVRSERLFQANDFKAVLQPVRQGHVFVRRRRGDSQIRQALQQLRVEGRGAQ